MTIKASGRSALIIAAGIWVCFSGPLHAAPNAETDPSAVSKPGTKATGAPIVLKKYTKARNSKKVHATQIGQGGAEIRRRQESRRSRSRSQ